MSRSLLLLIPAVLLLASSTTPLVVVEAKSVEVKLATQWRSSIVAEMLEAVRAEDAGIFRAIVNDAYNFFSGASSDQEKLDRILTRIKEALPEPTVELIKANTISRVYAPRIETQQQQLDYRVDGGCRAADQLAVLVKDKFFCFSSLAEFQPNLPKPIRMSQGDPEPDIFPGTQDSLDANGVGFDYLHSHGPHQVGIHTLVLYAELGTKIFQEFHQWMSENGKHMSYIIRYKFDANSADAPVLPGYGTTLDIKNIEYKAVNEKDDGAAGEDDSSSSSFVMGFDIEKLASRYETDGEEIRKFAEAIDENSESNLKVWQLKDLGYQTVYSIMKSADPLQELTTVTQRFPLRVGRISKVPLESIRATTNVVEKVQMGWGEATNRFLFNGREISDEKLDLFELLEDAKKEKDIVTDVQHALGFNDTAAAKAFLNLPRFQQRSVKSRVWVDAEKVYWVNNVETDDQYSYMPKSMSELNKPFMYGQPPLPRRNVLNMVYLIDPENPDSFDVVDSILRMYQNGMAIRFGILIKGKKSHKTINMVRNCFVQIFKGDPNDEQGPTYALSFLRMINHRGIRTTSPETSEQDKINELCKSNFGIDVSGDISKEQQDENDVHDDYINGVLGLTSKDDSPAVFFNGQLFSKDEVHAAMYKGFNSEYTVLKQWAKSKKLTDKVTDVYSEIMELHGAKRRYNPYINTQKPVFAKLTPLLASDDDLPIGKNIVENLDWIYSSSFDDDEPLFSHILLQDDPAAPGSLQHAIAILEYLTTCGEECKRTRIALLIRPGDKKLMKIWGRIMDKAKTMSYKKQASHVLKYLKNFVSVMESEPRFEHGDEDIYGIVAADFNKALLKKFRKDEDLFAEYKYAIPRKLKDIKNEEKTKQQGGGGGDEDEDESDLEEKETAKKEAEGDRSSDDVNTPPGGKMTMNEFQEHQAKAAASGPKLKGKLLDISRARFYFSHMIEASLKKSSGGGSDSSSSPIRGPKNYLITNGRVTTLPASTMLPGFIPLHPDDIKSLEDQENERATAIFQQVQTIDWKAKVGVDSDDLNNDFFCEKLLKLHSIVGYDLNKRGGKPMAYSMPAILPEHTIQISSDSAQNTIHAMIDPLSRDAQKIVGLINTFSSLITSNVIITMNPPTQVSSIPIKNFYGHVAPQWSFTPEGRLTQPAHTFDGMPAKQVLTLGLDTPEAWIVMATDAAADVDNIKLNTIRAETLKAEYRLNAITVTGSMKDLTTGSHPRGMPVSLRHHLPPLAYNRWLEPDMEQMEAAPKVNTLVMSNYGYFQFPAPPGLFQFTLIEKGKEIYEMRSLQKDQEPKIPYSMWDRQKPFIIQHISLKGVFLDVEVEKRSGKEGESLLWDEKSGQDVEGAKTEWPPKIAEGSFEGPRDAPEKPTLNVFSVASGHLYERFLRMMMYSVTQKSKDVHGKNTTRIKFWLIENFLSPQFKAFLPKLTSYLGVEYQLVTYKWPHWLRKQTEKQRIIWAYKILFLDVLFPLDVEKIIFVDADQIVNTDLHVLYNHDLEGKPVGYTPFCLGDTSREETKGFRFWDSGYWVDHLRGLPYHISAIYVVDLVRLRQMAAGDQYRMIYDSLTQDPGSLANLDQDLPNFAQHQIPIHSLPQEWLWCETWCTDDSKAKAHTIDLCNNPLTKIPKLDNARRIVSNWDEMDQLLQKLEDDE